jgi:transcriptional regulator of acetoin/glycerol metabolism
MGRFDEGRLADARTLLEERGSASATMLPDEIKASWERCLAAGLDPRRPPQMRVAGTTEVREARGRHDLVLRLATAEMRCLNHQIAGTNYLIAFAAPDGMLLETIADPTFQPLARKSGICAGGIWGERHRGTNALGTVAATGRAIAVHGAEHFFAQFGGLTCTAAPVFGPDAALAGVLDASSDCRSRQTHTQALVSMAVTHIENGLFREHHRASFVLAFHSRAEYLHTSSAALIALDPEGRILGSNAQARFLLQGLPALPGRRFNEVFRTSFPSLVDRAGSQERLLINDAVGSSFVATAENTRRVPMIAMPRAQQARLPRPRFVADDPAVQAALRQVERAAARRLPVLIRGETGTGKDLLARHTHEASGRRGPFVPVNCAALPKTLIESELFGYAEGAFTGARRHGAKGLVEQADGGTLFLDEIGDMPADLQAVLLRLLDDWTVRPVGGERRKEVDVLLVAATNADLKERIEIGQFRCDLLYRLNVAEVRLPRLADRDDFDRIATELLTGIDPAIRIGDDALGMLRSHGWPGNIRELRNVLIRLSLLSDSSSIDRALVAKIVESDGFAAGEPEISASLRSEVRAHIAQVFRQEANNVSRTARRLNVSRNTVYRAVRAERAEVRKPDGCG